MIHKNPNGTPESRGPLRTMFLITSMPVGGAEVLLLNLVRRLDRRRVAPELCCLKELGPLGEELAGEIAVSIASNLVYLIEGQVACHGEY